MRIYITGCAKSGTTLLRRMFYAFENIKVIDYEISIEDFAEYPKGGSILIGKRIFKTIFSDVYRAVPVRKQINLIKNSKDLVIVNVIRDGRDVILSDDYLVPPLRWVKSMHQRRKFSHLIDFEVKYEDLITNPNLVQQDLISKFGLKKQYNFSLYPTFVPDKADNLFHPNYDLRPINEGNKNKNITEYKNIIKSKALLNRFHNELYLGGYI